MYMLFNFQNLIIFHCYTVLTTFLPIEMTAFGVIQSSDILGHVVKCFYVIGSIQYCTYYMIPSILTVTKTFR